ncbi:MAG: beta-N-acetylhexosaminidase [Deltaproteobacteria bacterium]|nr:beta-N-acetylhexosaminidase [Deltaproteobacteria bacterium]
MSDIGNLIMVGLEGLSLLHEEERFLSMAKPGGVIFFSRNMENRRQIQKLIRSLKRVTGRKDLWVAIDQEGGRINRWRSGFGLLPSAEEMGQELKRTKKGGLITDTARKIGKDLRALGFNLDFAPVLDVLTSSVNTVIGDRSFGKDPEWVSKAGILFMKGLESQGVMACGKHFPGHGGTVAGPQGDSHKELPTLTSDLQRLKKAELVPFARAIKAGIQGIMTAHLLLPKVDSQLPASLSAQFVTRILREQMKYKGVIFTDDLLMKGVTNHYSLGQAAQLAIQAGTDHLLICRYVNAASQVYDALNHRLASEKGGIFEGQVRQALVRIQKVKKRFG